MVGGGGGVGLKFNGSGLEGSIGCFFVEGEII